MISVLPVKDPLKLQEVYKKFGFSLTENSGCVLASSGDDILGCCLYDIDAKKIDIKFLSPSDDIMLADGILRSALHVADYNSVKEAFYSEKAPEELLIKLNFVKSTEEKSLKIEKLHESCHSCEKNNK